MERLPEEIHHPKVTLRRWRDTDLDLVYELVELNLDELKPWMPWAHDHGRESAAEFLARNDATWETGETYNYAIVVDSRVVGSCGLMSRIGPGGLEIGYWVSKEYTGRGIATAAARALAEAAFRLSYVNHVEIHHDELNRASEAIPRKLGYTEISRTPGASDAPEGNGVQVIWRLSRPAA
jgi:ribosomal-protein-serine acetyltransferase